MQLSSRYSSKIMSNWRNFVTVTPLLPIPAARAPLPSLPWPVPVSPDASGGHLTTSALLSSPLPPSLRPAAGRK